MIDALVIRYGGSVWARVHYRRPADPDRDPDRVCFECGRKLRRDQAHYRATTWGPDHDQTAYAHGKCLVGQIDPTIWDIGTPGR